MIKKEVLNIKDKLEVSYYCINDNCVEANDYISYVEFINNDGNKTKYITYTCTYEKINSKHCVDFLGTHNTTKYCTICKNNNECLSKKCVYNHCMFNDDNPITHCEDIYLGHRRAYMHCGKAYGEKCNNDNECSSKVCYENSCQINHKGPSDSEVRVLLYRFSLVSVVINE
ncbi:hypothetical protein H8356DRAFT_1337539 [Neocallimastix lanati (nom. inval.)]|nr:hypothetical protein H8356DRAFT_1337539 [Neocallimastix sp. JGI-2020a]